LSNPNTSKQVEKTMTSRTFAYIRSVTGSEPVCNLQSCGYTIEIGQKYRSTGGSSSPHLCRRKYYHSNCYEVLWH
jgi:hypothetical protein